MYVTDTSPTITASAPLPTNGGPPSQVEILNPHKCAKPTFCVLFAKCSEIANLEFENHKNLNFSIFRWVVRARKKIYLCKYYFGFFKIY